jgi:hypothetical protein
VRYRDMRLSCFSVSFRVCYSYGRVRGSNGVSGLESGWNCMVALTSSVTAEGYDADPDRRKPEMVSMRT